MTPGAQPPATYHWREQPVHRHPPFISPGSAPHLYYGKNVFDDVGSIAHEAFIYNVAMGRLDVYTYDIWNLNQCQCAYPQPGLDVCVDGFYR
jgi:hypothetical protein